MSNYLEHINIPVASYGIRLCDKTHGFDCTREEGHEMPHAAHGFDDDNHPIAIWDDEGMYEGPSLPAVDNTNINDDDWAEL